MQSLTGLLLLMLVRLTAAAGGVSAAELKPAGDTGIRLPPGFEATVFADRVGMGRHIAAAENGDVYVALNESDSGQGIVALRDTNGDGSADRQEYFADATGTGIALHKGYLYFGTNTRILRWRRESGELVPAGEPEVIVDGFEDRQQHAAKAITLDDQGNLYVNVGAPSNACQEEPRTQGSPGEDPCPLLEEFAGVWRYSAERTDQQHPGDGERYVTGVRNAVALEWSRPHDGLYLVQHGRDQLDELFPQHFTTAERVELPAEEFHHVTRGSNLGWPYTYWDPERNARMIAPEYGGDGETVSDNNSFQEPLIGFPAHWGPNDLLFYTGEQWPADYQNGAFVAFHGSWNRAPEPQAGYQVVFIPMSADGQPDGQWRTFADGFAGTDKLINPRNAAHRPTGLAQDSDGALYVSDSIGGRVWRITYKGE